MDKNLTKFKKNNSSVNVVTETEHLNIENLWADSTFMCRFSNNEDFSSLANVFLPAELAALYHSDTKTIEFIYAPIDKDHKLISRKFNFYYKGIEFTAEFKEPSEALVLLATAFREVGLGSSTNYRNLVKFRDFYKKDTMPNFVKNYFGEKVPIVFSISGDFDALELDFVSFSKNLNFYLDFYDRKSPWILIYEQDREAETYNLPCYSNGDEFPSTLNTREIDPVLVDLFGVAKMTSNSRLKFLFYFQVLEYCSYYHLTEEFKKKLTNIIKRPDLLVNSSYYGKLITEEFKDNFKMNDDSVKLEKLIVEYVVFDDIKMEIQDNAEYFKKDIVFDGGFVIGGLISNIEELNSPPKQILKTIKTNIEKIRNVLVHIRESRENKIILPTKRNTNLLLPYLHLVKRIAEKVAIQYE